MPVHLSPYAIDVALYFCGTRAKQTGKNMKKGGVVVVPTEIVCAQHWAFRHISNCVGVGPSLPYSSWKACHKYWCVLSMGEWPSTEPKHLYNDISIGVDQLWWGEGGGKGRGGGGALFTFTPYSRIPIMMQLYTCTVKRFATELKYLQSVLTCPGSHSRVIYKIS